MTRRPGSAPIPADVRITVSPTAIASIAHAESLFGVGSQMARAARIAIEGPPRHVCGCGRTVNGTYAFQCGDCYRRDRIFYALWLGFSRVMACIETVETRAAALFVADLADDKTLTEWREVAFRETAETFAADPWSLPFMRSLIADESDGDS